MLAVTLNEEYPRLAVIAARASAVCATGPYSHAWAIRETVDLLTRVFPARTCTNGCSNGIGRWTGRAFSATSINVRHLCIDRVTADEHRRIVGDFCDFLAGRTDQLIHQLERGYVLLPRISISSGRPGCATTSTPAPGDGEAGRRVR